ncbi:MAG: hypothetical protein U0271_47945 [Polyangiaceae bacterium]
MTTSLAGSKAFDALNKPKEDLVRRRVGSAQRRLCGRSLGQQPHDPRLDSKCRHLALRSAEDRRDGDDHILALVVFDEAKAEFATLRRSRPAEGPRDRHQLGEVIDVGPDLATPQDVDLQDLDTPQGRAGSCAHLTERSEALVLGQRTLKKSRALGLR